MAKDRVYTQEMGQPPKEPDSASAGRKFGKNEPNMPEQPGSRIRVDGKPLKPEKKMAPGGKVTDKVDYEKDLHEYARTGTDKINKPVKKLEDLKMLKDAPEAAVKLVAALVGSPFASAASGAVNAYRDLPSGKKMRENLGSSYKKGGSISSASSRADGCATKGKTKGRFV
jgi:hypothetical protein